MPFLLLISDEYDYSDFLPFCQSNASRNPIQITTSFFVESNSAICICAKLVHLFKSWVDLVDPRIVEITYRSLPDREAAVLALDDAALRQGKNL